MCLRRHHMHLLGHLERCWSGVCLITVYSRTPIILMVASGNFFFLGLLIDNTGLERRRSLSPDEGQYYNRKRKRKILILEKAILC